MATLTGVTNITDGYGNLPTNEGGLVYGAYALGHIPEEYKLYDMDRLDKLSIITRGMTRFYHYISSEMGLGKARRVSTFEPRTQTINELDYQFQLFESSNDTDASNTKLKVLNKYGRNLIKVNDVLVVKGLYHQPNNTTTQYSTTFGKVNDEFFTQPEVLYVTDVTAYNGGGTGYSVVTVRRGISSAWTYPSYDATKGSLKTAPTSPPPITPDMVLMKAGNAFAHGTGMPTGDFTTPFLDGNYMQELKWAVEMVVEQEMERTYQSMNGDDPMDLRTRLKMQQMSWEHERALLFGRKAKTMNADGNPLYFTGGVLEDIMQDDEHIIPYTGQTINYLDFNTLGNKIFLVGGGERKTAFSGYTLLTNLQNSFYNKFMFIDQERSAAFHIPVYKIMTGAGELNIVATYGMQTSGFDDKMLIIDTSVPAFEKNIFNGKMKVNGSGSTVVGDFDMLRVDNLQLPGEMVNKTGYVSIFGWQRRCPQYHSIVYDLNKPVAKYTKETEF